MDAQKGKKIVCDTGNSKGAGQSNVRIQPKRPPKDPSTFIVKAGPRWGSIST